MTVSEPKAVLFNGTVASTAELATEYYFAHPAATRTTFLIESDQALTINADELVGTDPVQFDTGVAVAAGAALKLVYDFGINGARLRFTAAAQPATVRITATYHGHGQPS